MSGQPVGAKEPADPEKQLRTHRRGALQGGFERSHVIRRFYENEHGAKSHRHDENGRQDGSNGGDDHFHGNWLGPRLRGQKKDSAIGRKAERGKRESTGWRISHRERQGTTASQLSASSDSHRPREWHRWVC